MSGGGGGAPQAQQVTSTTSNLPEYARPYFENLMNRAQAESYREYTPYEGQRLAGFTPEQQQVQQQTMGLQTPGQFGAASNFASAAGLGSLAASQYTPTSFNNQQIGQPNLLNYQMSSPGNVGAQNYSAPQMSTARTGFTPNLQNLQMGPASSVQAQTYDTLQMGPASSVQAQTYNSPQMQAAQTGFSPTIQSYDMGPVSSIQTREYNAPTMQAAQTNFDAGKSLRDYQMDQPDMFGQTQVNRYMSPYIQNVMNVQKREALTDAKKAQLAQNLGAVRQGSYGGARQLLATTERERALGQQLGDIQARGLQSAFENSQQQFERDRTAGMSADSQNLQALLQTQGLRANLGQQVALANLSSQQQANVQNQAAQLQTQGMNAEQAMRAALANQQADLTVGQQNQQARMQAQQLSVNTGLQTALANLSSEQQANVQNQAAQLQTQGLNAEQAMRAALANQQAGLTVGQQNLQAGLQTQGLNAEQAMRAALANQQAGLTVGQQNLQAGLQTQQLGTQTGLQTALANLSSEQQANVQNQAAQLQTQGLNAEQAMRAALANQQTGLAVGQQNLNASLDTQKLGATTGLQALLANQQTNLEAQRLGEQSRQFGASNRLQGLGQVLESGRTLGNLGLTQQQADLQRLQAQSGVAGQQQQLEQQQLDMAYADFLRQRDYPMEQLGYYGNLLRGVPVQLGSTATTYAQPPSMGAQVGGLGLGALSMYQMAQG